MKNKFFSLLLLAGTVCSFQAARANVEVNSAKSKPVNVSRSTEAGDCAPSASEFNMDVNNVRAMLLGGGDMWWNFTAPQYNVPKSNGTTPAVDALFAGSIWITGLDAGGNLKCAAVRYRQNGNDYWPGPLTNGTVDAAVCTQYDVHFSVLGTDIAAAQTAYLQNGTATTEAMIPKDVLSWPGEGNPFLASDPTLMGQTYAIPDVLAPFKDVDGNGIYDPTQGDYPVIPTGGNNASAHAYADQMVFWVFNDEGNIHTESGGTAIGVQVNALGFAFQSTDNINNMTFYTYQIINKSSNKLLQTYMSQWVDPDLGCYENDLVGCDTTRSLGICYNGTIPDPDCGIENGYQYDLPVVGVDFFQGPLSDSGTQIGLTSFVYFTNGAVFSQQDPETAAQYRNYQTGFWNDGTPFTTGGTGYNASGGTKTKFIFPGNPSDPNAWSECSAKTTPGDRRFVQSSGPFTLNPGIQQYITVGVVFVQPNTTDGVGLCPDFTQNIDPADDEAQNLFNTGFQLLNGPDAPTLQIRELENQLIINLVNLPGSNNVGENYAQVDGATEQAVKLLLGGHGDSTYRFQGYQLYQVVGPTVSAQDLAVTPSNPTINPAVAQLVADVNLQNGVTQIINFFKDPNLGLYVPLDETPSTTNSGVVNSFVITQDLFATGNNKNLVNHTTYYFAAIAYAYNNYLQFNPSDPQAGGQLTPYIQGRNNFNIYAGIPHTPDPRNDGTVLHSQWGQGVNVQRIEGSGNGGNSLQLTPDAVTAILNSGSYAFEDTLTYAAGNDPLGFKVTDPISLIEGDFELQFVDTTGSGKPIGNTTSWFLRDVTNGDTIYSDRTLDRQYEQQIMITKNSQTTDYGFSITLGTPPAVYTIPNNYLNPYGVLNRNTYEPLNNNDSIRFSNPSQEWLSFLASVGNTVPTHWIRSGTYAANPSSSGGIAGGGTGNPLAGVYDDNWYYIQGYGSGSPPAWPNFIYDDSNDVYNTILNGEWAPYCLTANYNLPSTVTPGGGAPQYVYGPGFRWYGYPEQAIEIAPPQNTLDKLASVDIVLTPDKTKWTRCVVFETGENESINQGIKLFQRSSKAGLQADGAFKGQIRMAYSLDMNSNGQLLPCDGTQSSLNYEADTGRSWFPGYAINVETGERLNVAFGESSDQPDQNGTDMLWNPTQNLYSPLGATYFAGKHCIYVMSSKYDQGQAVQSILLRTYDSILPVSYNTAKSVYPVYQQLMWTCIPYLSQGYDYDADAFGLKCLPPCEVTIQLRMQNPYSRYATVATNLADSNATMPRYHFSTFGLGAKQGQQSVAQSVLDEIKIVPNPYLSYSSYETSQNSTVVMITNLPNVCTVSIYSLDGTLINQLSRAIGINPATQQQIDESAGGPVNVQSVESSLTWDMKNTANIPISSGVYLFHVEAPGIGQKTLKWFCTIRPADTSDY